ncbi:MAG: hypothetical protein AB8B80_05590 [Marinicellaceae bacterium]
MTSDLNFTYIKQNDDYHIFHHGKKATILRGNKALDFQADIETLSNKDLQQLMARLTGNYKHGNERTAKNHPRNRIP